MTQDDKFVGAEIFQGQVKPPGELMSDIEAMKKEQTAETPDLAPPATSELDVGTFVAETMAGSTGPAEQLAQLFVDESKKARRRELNGPLKNYRTQAIEQLIVALQAHGYKHIGKDNVLSDPKVHKLVEGALLANMTDLVNNPVARDKPAKFQALRSMLKELELHRLAAEKNPIKPEPKFKIPKRRRKRK